ncbi:MULTISPECIES: ComF family protein [Deefgea]|uniref:ComF family protein n=1 Tax=Deefgea TaxID=400947 RepID=UPI00194402A9|nr:MULTISPECIES: ComF family protein [Deefgea]MBM9887696.1 ComF family protein [Deefgea sp. CFH1-16]
MSNFIDTFLNYIAPHQCILCAAPSSAALCTACYPSLPRWEASNSCPRCGHINTQGHLCGACQTAPPAFDRTYAAFLYTEPISSLIQAAKFANRWSLLPPLGAYLAQITPEEQRPNRLIALPLHPARLRERGFNQAVEIARPIAKLHQLPLEIDTLQRIKNTEHQARLNANARWQNMRGAFVYSGNLTGQRVAIIDDVMTSGASLNAAAKALKLAGAIEVQAWVVARTP